VNEVLNFLAGLFQQQQLSYRTIGVYKSAISQTHDPVGSASLGTLPIVSRFMKGIFRQDPPKPKLCTTWEVKVALSYMRGQKPAAELSLKELSHKLILLLALTSAARAHELAALDLAYLAEKEDSWEFVLDIHTKQSRPNHPGRKIFLPVYKECQHLCVVHTLKEYRKRTEAKRRSSRLLLAMVSPHRPISSQTVSRWLRDALTSAGISPTYSGHSTRSASTSAAAESGIALETILEAADWASAGTFRTFYQRPTSRETFARTVISQ
jgi:site-specific recombinase XerD